MGVIVFQGRSVTSEQFEDRVLRAMTGFKELGVGEGDAVLILLRNDPVFLEAMMAVGKLGAYPVPANWHGNPEEIRTIIQDSGAKFAVVHDDLALSLGAGFPPDLQVVIVKSSGTGLPDGATNWGSLVESNERFAGNAVRSRGALIYTSGTTSAPKAIDREAMAPEQERNMTVSLLRTYGFRSGMRALICGPLYHSMTASYARTALASMGEHGALFIEPKFDAEKLLDMIAQHRITHLLMVPVMFVRLLKLDPEVRARFDVSSIECVTHSAAPCSREVKEAVIDWWGPVLQEFFGTSETGPVTLITSAEYRQRPGSVGRPQEGCTIHILDDQGTLLPPGTAGEVAARNSFYPDFTYRHRDEERARLERNGLIATGDIGYLDEENYLYLLDRKKDMIITGGVNVYPAEIEAVLLTMPVIRDCAVFGIPDDEFGESMAAHIELCIDCHLAADAVVAYLRERLPSYKIPKVIRFENSLPREDNGKIYKRRLADPYWAGTGRRI
jgi:long-chain acyl-CoA synthetase